MAYSGASCGLLQASAAVTYALVSSLAVHLHKPAIRNLSPPSKHFYIFSGASALLEYAQIKLRRKNYEISN